MIYVLLTALGVGSATVIGALFGFLFKNVSHRFSDITLSFAAGVMLAAAVLGLIIPSIEYGGKKYVLEMYKYDDRILVFSFDNDIFSGTYYK